MRKVVGRTVLVLFLMLASFIAGRTWSRPDVPHLPGEFAGNDDDILTRLYDLRPVYRTLYRREMFGPMLSTTPGPTVDGGLFAGASEPPIAEEFLELTQELVTETVDPDSWRSNGGQLGIIRGAHGFLIVTNRKRTHDGVANALNAITSDSPNAIVWRPATTQRGAP